MANNKLLDEGFAEIPLDEGFEEIPVQQGLGELPSAESGSDDLLEALGAGAAAAVQEGSFGLGTKALGALETLQEQVDEKR
jgi:hypothetical protein